MNLDQTTEQIINSSNAEQRILWNSIFLSFGNKIGVAQLNYNGLAVGSEFLTYSAHKLYFALKFMPTGNAQLSAGIGTTTFFDTSNAVEQIIATSYPAWDATAAAFKFMVSFIVVENIIFSRITQITALLPYIQFIGYRLSI